MSYKTTGTSRILASSAVSSSVAVVNTGSGFTVSGPSITANTPFQTSVITPGAASTSVAISGLKITGIIVTDSSWNNLDDTAVGPSGGYIKVIGTGFASGATAYLNGAAITTTFQSSTELRVVIPSSTVGTYSLMVFNADGSGAVYLNLALSALPTFTTDAGSLATLYEISALSAAVSAAGDSPFTYSLYSGSLPPGVTLSSSGVLSGTTQATETQTTYSFVIRVTDIQNQDNLRAFSITINPDVVSWINPVDNQTITYNKNSDIVPISLSAISAAEKTITYSASNLPAGIVLTGSTLSGTISTDTASASTLTATAAETGRLQNISIIWAIQLSDPSFMYNTLLLQNSDINNQTNNVFVDSSVNNLAVTRAGNTTQGTFSPYGSGWSNYFDGNGDYLTLPTTSGAFNFGTGNFTIEMWIWPDTVTPGYQQLAGSTYSSTGGAVYLVGSTLTFYTNGVNAQSATNSIKVGQWQHIAVVRDSGVLKTYINGVESGSAANTQNLTSNTGQIGLRTGSTTIEPYKGYISNLRVVKSAIYSANFTPPTQILAAVANTSLLTCQSNRFVDNSTNSFVITRSGNTSIQKFNPYGILSPAGTSASYMPAIYGGSISFDGAGDYLSVEANAAHQLGTSSYTVEFWMHPTVVNATQRCLVNKNGASTYGYTFRMETSNKVVYYTDTATLTPTTVLAPNTWYHIAATFDGTTTRLFVNGVQEASTTVTTGITNATGPLFIGARQSDQQMPYAGYLSDVRVVKGAALYTANFVPPTTPLTAITDTSVLIKGTGAAIYDASTLNDLETLGDIKTSTAVSKWGTSSIAFDGNGDYLSMPYSPMFAQTGPYTVEGWFYPTSTASSVQALFARNAGGYFGVVWTGSILKVDKHAIGIQITGTTTLALNTWHHWAMTFDGTTTRLFANGILQGSVTGTGGETAAPTTIGYYTATATSSFYGYMSDFRFTRGLARYIVNFTPPAELPSK